MKFKVYSSLDQLSDQANQLFAEFEKKSLFYSKPWFENLTLNSLKPTENPFYACVIDGDDVLAILPLLKRTEGEWDALSSNFSNLFTPLVHHESQHDILSCLARGLLDSDFQYLQITPYDDDNVIVHDFKKTLETVGFQCHRHPVFYNWFYSVNQQSFKDYLTTRPPNLRNTIKRKHRKLEREQGCHIKLYKTLDDNLEQAVNDYNQVYSASWKANEPFDEFIKGLAQSFAKEDWLRLAILYVDDKPIAGQFWFVSYGKASIFRLAYDQSWSKYSPGSILTSFLMEYVIDTDQVEEIDFLMGNDKYKQDWMSERRERWSLNCRKEKSKLNKIEKIKRFLKLS